MKKPQDPLISRLAAAVAESDPTGRGRGRRSPLTVWLTNHRDEFAAIIAGKEPNWDALAAELAAGGVMAGDGTLTPTGTRLRKSWWALNRKDAKPPRRKTSKPLLPFVSDLNPAPSSEVGDDSPPRPSFKIAQRPK